MPQFGHVGPAIPKWAKVQILAFYVFYVSEFSKDDTLYLILLHVYHNVDQS